MKSGAMGPGREFDLIRRILSGVQAGDPAAVPLGPGDDAALIAPDLAISTDLAVEGVHFRRDWLTPREVGARAALAALSDLSAMGAEPLAVFSSLAGTPGDATDGTLEGVGKGVAAAAAEAGAVLAGGDLTRSPGPLVASITVLGRTAAPLRRSGAQVGDDLWVSGALGGAAGAVAIWLEGTTPPAALRKSFARPPGRWDLGRALAHRGLATAALDLSDGLVPDVAHLAAASGVGVAIAALAVPVAPALAAVFAEDRANVLALSGGEDYELAFTAPPTAADAIRTLSLELDVALTRVGEVRRGEGVQLLGPEGEILPLPDTGFRHFPSA